MIRSLKDNFFLASQYFLSDHHDAWMKVPFKMQNRPVDFNVTKVQFIDAIFYSILQIIFKNCLWVWVYIKEGRLLKYSFSDHIPVMRIDFICS